MREPVRGDYRGFEIVSMPPPSSGGVHIVQILNTLEGFPIGFVGAGGAETVHLMAEAMKLAYADRSASWAIRTSSTCPSRRSPRRPTPPVCAA